LCRGGRKKKRGRPISSSACPAFYSKEKKASGEKKEKKEKSADAFFSNTSFPCWFSKVRKEKKKERGKQPRVRPDDLGHLGPPVRDARAWKKKERSKKEKRKGRERRHSRTQPSLSLPRMRASFALNVRPHENGEGPEKREKKKRERKTTTPSYVHRLTSNSKLAPHAVGKKKRGGSRKKREGATRWRLLRMMF